MIIIKILGVIVAVCAFSILLETPPRYLWCTAIVGAVGSLAYFLCLEKGINNVASSFVSALFIALLSHTFARVMKAPVILFLIAGILPTVPGAGMYRIVFYLIEGNSKKVSYYFSETMQIAGVIALAIFLMDTVFRIFQSKEWKREIKQQDKIAK
ncbi:MAG: threonine/serine exporter family protein [Lachnospiraceae bacterium]